MIAPTDALPVRMRSDLVTLELAGKSGSQWTIKDPVSLAYFRLDEIEFAILRLLDGKRSLADVLGRLGRRFPGRAPAAELVQSYVATLVNSGLATFTISGAGQRQAMLSQARKHHQAKLKWLSVLAIRFRGIDPEPFLQKLEPLARVLFAPASLLIACAAIVAAFTLVVVNFGQLASQLPGLATLTSVDRILVLAMTWICVKAFHELGHAMALRHFGGECHEMGVLFLVFMPLPYCNVTDSWMQPDRWPRIAVAGAGILVELVLAAVCTFLWLQSSPGPMRVHLLHVMMICSVSTVLFNANPLLRYDGYYILSDLLDIPNLASAARDTVSRTLQRIVFGACTHQDDLKASAKSCFLFIYGVAAGIYRWVVLFGILWFVHQTLRPHGLGTLTWFVAAPTLFASIVIPLRQSIARLWKNRSACVSRRGVIGGFVSLCLAGLLLFFPFPHRIHAPFVMRPSSDRAIFVAVAGRIEQALASGTTVNAGDIIARLTNPEVDLACERASGDVRRAEVKLSNLESMRSRNIGFAEAIPTARDALSAAQTRLISQENRRKRLEVRSPSSGIIVQPPNRPSDFTPDGISGFWTGIPQSTHNRGALLREQTLLCYIEPVRGRQRDSSGDTRRIRIHSHWSNRNTSISFATVSHFPGDGPGTRIGGNDRDTAGTQIGWYTAPRRRRRLLSGARRD